MLTWTCHVCGDERPDDKISVFSRPRDFGHGIVAQENIRYCNDRASCIEGAKTTTHFPNLDDPKQGSLDPK